MRRPALPRVLRELITAHSNARREDLAQALDVCGLRQTGGPIWGVDFVSIVAHHYAPEPGGRPALIVPYVDDGAILDLVAVSFAARTSRTREGICTVLGADQMDLARDHERQLRLYADPIEWLQRGRQGACMIDWRADRHVLAGVPAIVCSNDKLAARVTAALRQPVKLPDLYVREAAHAP